MAPDPWNDGMRTWRNMEKHGYGSIPINTINPSYFDVHQGYKVLTQCHIRTWRGVSPIALCPENTVDCHVAPFYPNETPTFSSKATNRSSCGTAEVDFHCIPIGFPGDFTCSRSLTATLDTAPRECKRLMSGVAHQNLRS